MINIGKAEVYIRDEEGYTPLHVAMKNGAKEVVSYISNSGMFDERNRGTRVTRGNEGITRRRRKATRTK